MSSSAALEVTRLVPIIFAKDAKAERDFYVKLGFAVTYEGDEYPGFIAVGSGSVEFGIERKDDFEPATAARVVIWQFGIKDVDEAKAVLEAASVPYTEETMSPRDDWRYRTLRATTPNGYHLLLEGENEAI